MKSSATFLLLTALTVLWFVTSVVAPIAGRLSETVPA